MPSSPHRRSHARLAFLFTSLFTVTMIALAVVALTVLGLPIDEARAAWPPPDDDGIDLSDPQYWPSDPDYENRWNYWSWIHPDAVTKVTAFSPYELGLGSGSHVDRAWQKTTGDRRVVMAILDGGIRWSVTDLVNQHYLNRGELPAPDSGCGGDGATYDVNGDGWFNVQDYTSNQDTELPALVCDTRLLAVAGGWDVNNTGFLDPQDLIAAFSDGVDDDDNGWVDDISGWDAYDDTNDPDTDTDFYHGKNTASQAGAQGNDGQGSIGTCPHCSQLQVRVGESFVVDVNDFAVGIIFAVDSGASVIVAPVGSINNTALSRQAIDYAWAHGVAVVASAADENSYHHNFPGTNNHTIYQHAIQFDSTNHRNASTYLNFANCTNYGAQLALSTPGTLCSSESTGRTGGMVGLLYAMALAVDLPFPGGAPDPTDKLGARRLHADEVRQLLIGTVDDIHDPATATDPTRYPTRQGWEARFGYGRTNIGSAVRAVEAGRIPPVVDLDEPLWFQPLYPAQSPWVDLVGQVRFRTADASGLGGYHAVDLVIEWAPGIEPDDEDFTVIHEETGIAGPREGVLATWDISGLTVDNPPQGPPDYVANRYLVTLRIRAVAHNTQVPELDGVKAELRKAVHVVRDPDLLPGFPIYVGAGGLASPKLADLDGNGALDIVYADNNGKVHAFRGDGTYVEGWPALVSPLPHLDPGNAQNHRGSHAFLSGAIDPDVRSAVVASPAVADLEGDEDLDVVAATLDGHVYAWDSSGAVKTGFPVTLDRSLAADPSEFRNLDSGVFAAPSIGDLDGDGDHEIVVGAYDGHVYVWHHDGAQDPGFPVNLHRAGDEYHGRILSSPSLGDLDGDGALDIVVGSSQVVNSMGSMWAVHGDGNAHAGGPFLQGWPVQILSIELLPLVGVGITSNPALADFDGDGTDEVVIAGHVGPPQVIGGDGFPVRAMETGVQGDPTKAYGPGSDSTDMPLQAVFTNPSLGDLSNDGRVNIIMGAGGLKIAATFAQGGTRLAFDHLLGAWDGLSGRFLWGFPRIVDDWQFFMSSAVADVDGDGLPEAISGSAGYYLHAFNVHGEEPEGWPKFTGGWIGATAAVGDVDGDGNLDVVTSTRNGWLFAWRTPGAATGRVDWSSFKHDNRNTGNLRTPLDQGSQQPACNPDPTIDADGDGLPNELDGDIDGDGIPNVEDDDVDNDGLPNDWDFDDDGDCVPDEQDDTPQGPARDFRPKTKGCGGCDAGGGTAEGPGPDGGGSGSGPATTGLLLLLVGAWRAASRRRRRRPNGRASR